MSRLLTLSKKCNKHVNHHYLHVSEQLFQFERKALTAEKRGKRKRTNTQRCYPTTRREEVKEKGKGEHHSLTEESGEGKET